MAEDRIQPHPNGGLPYLRKTSFLKVFSRLHHMRFLPEFDALHGEGLPLDCRIIMATGVSWTVGVLRLANGNHFSTGWSDFVRDNLFKHGDFLTFTGWSDFVPPRWNSDDEYLCYV